MTRPADAGERTDPGLQTASEAGIHAISLPTPFAIGRVNCYLSEVLGHLDLLVAGGRVAEDSGGPVSRFSLSRVVRPGRPG